MAGDTDLIEWVLRAACSQLWKEGSELQGISEAGSAPLSRGPEEVEGKGLAAQGETARQGHCQPGAPSQEFMLVGLLTPRLLLLPFPLFLLSFNKYIQSTYCVPGLVF